MKKILKSIVLVIISIALLLTILIFEIKDWPAGSSIAGIFTGFSLQLFGSHYKIFLMILIGKILKGNLNEVSLLKMTQLYVFLLHIFIELKSMINIFWLKMSEGQENINQLEVFINFMKMKKC